MIILNLLMSIFLRIATGSLVNVGSTKLSILLDIEYYWQLKKTKKLTYNEPDDQVITI